MSSASLRIVLAVGLTGVAVAVALSARVRERRRAALAPLDLAAFEGRLVLITSADCRTCEQAKQTLGEAEVDFVEVTFEHEGERLRTAGVTAVPLFIGRDAAGNEVGRIAGKIGRRSLARLLARMESGG